ncbi:MAG: hypothetical protein HKN47_10975 [Pirellulaceae bacterium]|nr:hypothetical protein [Pirellulaceae bacterium]
MSTDQSIRTQHGYELEFVNETGTVVGRRRIKSTDFGHAVRDAAFDALKRGLIDDLVGQIREVTVEPLYIDPADALPETNGFRVTLGLVNAGEHVYDYSLSYFTMLANQERAEMNRMAQSAPSDQLRYRLQAFLDDDGWKPNTNKLSISLHDERPNISLRNGSLNDFASRDRWDDCNRWDVPVVVDQSVVEEVVDESKATPDREIGGFLLGDLHRDRSTGEIFVSVTGLVSAAGTTESSEISVTFTPASFVHARKMIELRSRGESIVGWYHSHPFTVCAECPIPMPKECIEKILFFSADDVHVMATTFERPHMIGLLAAVEPRIEQAIGHLPVKLYGWRHGEIRPRGFDVVRNCAD